MTTSEQQDMVLTASGLVKTWQQGQRQVEVLRGVNLAVKRGEKIAIVGVSGSGKSTLLHLLAGLDKPDAGSIRLAGVELANLNVNALGKLRNRHLGFVYQFHHLLPEFTALENVALPLRIAGHDWRHANARAGQLVDRVGLADRASFMPGQLSGGERQRVAIARALANSPDLVLADEPTGNLDEQTALQIHELVVELASDLGLAFVMVTHNRQLASLMDRQLQLHGGILE